jgi:hypothetical protein
VKQQLGAFQYALGLDLISGINLQQITLKCATTNGLSTTP